MVCCVIETGLRKWEFIIFFRKNIKKDTIKIKLGTVHFDGRDTFWSISVWQYNFTFLLTTNKCSAMKFESSHFFPNLCSLPLHSVIFVVQVTTIITTMTTHYCPLRCSDMCPVIIFNTRYIFSGLPQYLFP